MTLQEEISMEDTQKFLARDDSNISKDKKIEFCGLSKEEVMKYADDPFWVRLRWFLFVLFWVLWFGMIIAAALIVVYTPGCPHRPKTAWWTKNIAYEIDVAKFKSSGIQDIGDLKGKIRLIIIKNIQTITPTIKHAYLKKVLLDIRKIF